jgi:hypothetical protein
MTGSAGRKCTPSEFNKIVLLSVVLVNICSENPVSGGLKYHGVAQSLNMSDRPVDTLVTVAFIEVITP